MPPFLSGRRDKILYLFKGPVRMQSVHENPFGILKYTIHKPQRSDEKF